MVKRDITETIYEYDKEGKLIRKTVTETHETEEGTTLTYPNYPLTPCTPNDNWWQQPYVTWCNADSRQSNTTTDATSINTTTTTTKVHN